MKKVLQVVENPVESRFLFHFFKNLRESEAYELHLLNLCQGDLFFQQMQPLLASYTSLGTTRRYFLKFPVLLWALRRLKPDLVHAHEFIPAGYVALGLILTFSRATLIYHRHHATTSGWKAKLLDTLAAWRADKILTVSAGTAQITALEHPHYRRKIATCWNGIAVAEPKTVLPSSRREILLLARLRPDKGHLVAIEALAHVLARIPEALLIFAGDGPYLETLKDAVRTTPYAHSINFLGHVDDVSTLIQRCELVIMPSTSEAFGLVALEAMALKKLVIASRVGGLPEIISHQKTGVLVPPKDSGALAREIIHYLQHPAERGRLAEAGYQRYLKYFTSQAMAHRVLEGYHAASPQFLDPNLL